MSNKWESLKDKGNDEFKKQNYTLAISLYSDAIKLDSNQDSTYANRGLCYINQKKFTQAKSDLNKAILINSKNIKALKRLAYCHLTLGELLDAEMYLKRCVELEQSDQSHKDDVKVVKDIISWKEELNKAKFVFDYKKSEILAEKILQKCSEESNIKLIYIDSLLNNCKSHDALNFIRYKVSDEDSKKEEFQYLLCQAYYHDGKFEKAKQILTVLIAKANEKTSEKYKKLWDTLKELESEKERANDFFKKNDYDSAICLYTKLLDIDTNNKTFISTILSNRALCYQKKNKIFDAMTDINKSISLNENYWKAFYRRATLNIALKNPTKAREDLQKVLALDPNNRDAVLLLDDIQREEKKAKRRDFYKILGVNKTTSQDEIRKAYKKLAGQWHPDKNRETEEMKEHAEMMFKDINESYNILSDPKKKKIYDEGGHPDDPNSAFHMHNQEKETFDDVFNSFFGNDGKHKDNKERSNYKSDKERKDSFSNKKRHRDDDRDRRNKY